LRNELLGTNPALEAAYTENNETIRAAIAANVEVNVAMGLAQDKLEWLHERAQRNLDSIVSEAKLAKAVEKKILDAYDKGRLSGISEGRQIDAQAQYNLGLA
jgi:hypothetical protein